MNNKFWISVIACHVLIGVYTFGHAHNKIMREYVKPCPICFNAEEKAGIGAALAFMAWPFYWSVVLQEASK